MHTLRYRGPPGRLRLGDRWLLPGETFDLSAFEAEAMLGRYPGLVERAGAPRKPRKDPPKAPPKQLPKQGPPKEPEP